MKLLAIFAAASLTGVFPQIDHAPKCAALGILAPVHDATNAGMQNGTDTHGAGLDGDEQIGIGQPVVAHGLAGGTQRHDLRVR